MAASVTRTSGGAGGAAASFSPQGVSRHAPAIDRYTYFLGSVSQKAYYRVVASDANYRESAPSATVPATTRSMTDDELLTMLHEACFRYY